MSELFKNAYNESMKNDRKASFVKEKKEKTGKFLLEYVGILLASIPYAAGVALFLSPNQLAAGGVTGISIILHHVTGIGAGTFILLLNIPILLLGLWKFGFRFLFSTIYALSCISVFTDLLERLPGLTQDRILAALIGGALVAVGMGVIFKCHATTGGIDILVKLLKYKFPHMKTGSLFLLMDSMVILLSAIVFESLEAAIYAALAVMVTTMTLDYVLYGKDEAKLIYIITNAPEKIADRLLMEVHTGVTLLHGTGAYSGLEKQVLFLVTQNKMAIMVEEIVKETDKNAFMIITKATEIYGEGYKNLFAERI